MRQSGQPRAVQTARAVQSAGRYYEEAPLGKPGRLPAENTLECRRERFRTGPPGVSGGLWTAAAPVTHRRRHTQHCD